MIPYSHVLYRNPCRTLHVYVFHVVYLNYVTPLYVHCRAKTPVHSNSHLRRSPFRRLRYAVLTTVFIQAGSLTVCINILLVWYSEATKILRRRVVDSKQGWLNLFPTCPNFVLGAYPACCPFGTKGVKRKDPKIRTSPSRAWA
jgi:hypothetical protein